MNKWIYVDLGIRVLTIIWAIFLIISSFFRFSAVGGLSLFGGVVVFSIITTALMLGLAIWLYWNWSEIPVLLYLIFVTWIRNMEIVEMSGIPVNVGRLSGSVFLLCLIGGIIVRRNS